MFKYAKIAAFGLILIVALSGCQRSTGKMTGQITNENRHVATFNAMQINGAYQVNVTAGKAQTISVTADKGIIEDVTTDVQNNVLYIHNNVGNSTPAQNVKLDIQVLNLNSVTMTGNNHVNIQGIKNDSMNVVINGNGNAQLAGQSNTLVVNISGSGIVDAKNLHVQQATVSLSGAGRVLLSVAQSIDAKVTGSGQIQYFGQPRSINADVAGSGKIIGVVQDVKKGST